LDTTPSLFRLALLSGQALFEEKNVSGCSFFSPQELALLRAMARVSGQVVKKTFE